TFSSPSLPFPPLFLFSPTSFPLLVFPFFFFNDTPTTEIYTLSLHDALPILIIGAIVALLGATGVFGHIAETLAAAKAAAAAFARSEEHTSELQSRVDLVCRLLLEKKKKKK